MSDVGPRDRRKAVKGAAMQQREGGGSTEKSGRGHPRMATLAYDRISSMLLAGHLRGGDLVQEGRLAEQLGLSRTPVRDALGRLEGEGLLTRIGRLLIVRRVTVKEFLDLLHVRLLIEPEAAALAAEKLDPEHLARLKDLVLEMPEAVSHEQLWSVDDQIHLDIVEAIHNDFLAQLVRTMRRRTRLFELAELPERRMSGREEHLALIEALMARDAERAKTAMRNHLEGVRAGVIRQLRSL